jgi:hypothetical protein
MRALKRATELRKRENETLEALLGHEKDDLLSHDGFLKFQEALRAAS